MVEQEPMLSAFGRGVVCCWLPSLSLSPLRLLSADLRSAPAPGCPAPPLFIAPPALGERRKDRTLPILSLAAIKRSVRSQQKMPF